MNSLQIEIAVAHFFNSRQNLIVPNVSWGLGFHYEIDVLVLTPANYAYEIEIKTSASDLRRDKNKKYWHNSTRIRRLYFAIPEKLQNLALAEIPPHSGLIVIGDMGETRPIKPAETILSAKKFTEKERQHLYELAAMRVWSLKEHLFGRLSKATQNAGGRNV